MQLTGFWHILKNCRQKLFHLYREIIFFVGTENNKEEQP